MLRVVTNLFWFAFLAEGVFSAADEALALGSGISPLAVSRSVFSLLFLLATFGMALAVSLTPRVPGRVVLPMVIYTWWASAGQAFPLNLLPIPELPLWLAFLQIVVAASLWRRYRQPGTRWHEPFGGEDGPRISWKRILLLGPTLALVALLCALISLCSGLAAEITSLTGGYVRVRPDGIYLVERQFESDGRQVRLAGMMHVARGDFYSGVLPPADPDLPSVVLVEGVTDQRRLLGDDGLTYTRVARMLNVTSQEESAFTAQVHAGLQEVPEDESVQAASERVGFIHFRHADVDVETFHPKTIAFILAVTAVFQAEDWRKFIEALADPASPISDETAQTQVMQDILYARNEKLMSEIDLSLKTYRRVIVPWGALHLSEVESWLRSRRFVQSGEVERKALSFW